MMFEWSVSSWLRVVRLPFKRVLSATLAMDAVLPSAVHARNLEITGSNWHIAWEHVETTAHHLIQHVAGHVCVQLEELDCDFHLMMTMVLHFSPEGIVRSGDNRTEAGLVHNAGC